MDLDAAARQNIRTARAANLSAQIRQPALSVRFNPPTGTFPGRPDNRPNRIDQINRKKERDHWPPAGFGGCRAATIAVTRLWNALARSL